MMLRTNLSTNIDVIIHTIVTAVTATIGML